MAVTSAALLIHRDRPPAGLEVFLVHPGGPFWARKDAGAWSLPKGEFGPDEDPLDAARREFAEETGQEPPDGPSVDLGEVRQRGGKVVRAFAIRGDVDAAAIVSNTFQMQWPPKSGTLREFPEVDRGEWFGVDEAVRRINPAQAEFLPRLADALSAGR
ncbi:hypothetical protein GOARA_050_00400 [Gordonia araii NBRC 100433]|uniref:Nudix hydrolase domain-containing protein n=1 Tax=Gordonia araii NBRC 100433 TaxID=1073574 RepID=G7H2A3_9ACTN|nr:NUDIX domain-containing protein [Gordonia araii]NNG97517.1 NUDIX domain-containing protein [Gordonia araii NBRC 100433]GAB09978.1 hypothetical protein GOARA_050_00400 [Gordonia araii NBRC 100433]